VFLSKLNILFENLDYFGTLTVSKAYTSKQLYVTGVNFLKVFTLKKDNMNSEYKNELT